MTVVILKNNTKTAINNDLSICIAYWIHRTDIINTCFDKTFHLWLKKQENCCWKIS